MALSGEGCTPGDSEGTCSEQATTSMTAQERDNMIAGQDLNISMGPVGSSFSLTEGLPAAINVGLPASYGVNVSHSERLFNAKDVAQKVWRYLTKD